MEISVVLCTRNRAAQLGHALDSLARLSFDGEWELVVVDNGSIDGTADVVRRFSANFSRPVLQLSEARPGLGRVRNAGLAASHGTLVAFTGDDCYPAPDWLQWIARLFAEHPLVGYIGGMVALFGRADSPVAATSAPRAQWIPPRGFVRPDQISGSNMAFRRDVLIRVGGFDDRFGAGAAFPAEDVDVQARVSADGWWGYYEPRMVVQQHRPRRESKAARRLDPDHDVGRGAYYMKSLLNPVLRDATMRNWAWAIRHQTATRTLREFRSAARFLASEFARRRREATRP